MKQLKARHIMLIAALCGMMSNCLGVLFNVAGLYFNPIAADFAIGRGDVSMAHTIASLGCAVGGVTGAWIGMTTDITVRGILLTFRFFQGGWKRIAIE